jgi:hypothetical protein
MPQLSVAAYGCLEGMWLPTSGHCCLNSIAYIGDSHYLDIDNNNAVIINAHLCSHSEQRIGWYDTACIQDEGPPRSRVQQLHIILLVEKPFWESYSKKSDSSLRFGKCWLFVGQCLLERDTKRHQAERQNRASSRLDLSLRCDL